MNVQGKYFSNKAKFHQTLTGIETGTQGVFATCVKGKEARCVGELYSLFDKVQMYSILNEGRVKSIRVDGWIVYREALWAIRETRSHKQGQ